MVFNNKSPYIKTLVESCKSMGITGINYIPLPYSELPDEEVFEMLKKAKYIIGVDYLLNKNVLLSDKYIRYLRYDTVLIGAKRVGAITSASELVFKINNFLFQTVTNKLTGLVNLLEGIDDTQSLFELCNKLDAISKQLEDLSGKSNPVEKFLIDQIDPDSFIKHSKDK